MSNNNALIAVLIIASLLVGGLFTYAAFPKEVSKEVIKEVVKQVPVNVTVEKIVTVDTSDLLLADAKAELLAEIADDRALRVFDDERFSVDEISISDVNDVTVVTDDSNRRDTETTVSFEAELKANSGDDDEKAVYKDCSVEVVFHSKASVDTEVSVCCE